MVQSEIKKITTLLTSRTCLAIMSGYWSPMFRYVLKDRRSVDDDGHQDAVDGVQKYDIPKKHRSAAGKIHSLQMTICY